MYQRSPHGVPVPVGHPVRSRGDLDRLSTVANGGATTELVRAGVANFKGQKALVGDVLGPYTVAWFLRGSTELLMDFVDDPKSSVKALMRFATDATKAKLRGAIEVGRTW